MAPAFERGRKVIGRRKCRSSPVQQVMAKPVEGEACVCDKMRCHEVQGEKDQDLYPEGAFMILVPRTFA